MKLRISGDKLTIASAHMLVRHDKCAKIHGHNYQVEIEIEGELDENNMVIDFSLFKPDVIRMLKQFDHKILIPSESKDLQIETKDKQVTINTCEGKLYRLPKEDVVFIPIESTTIELLSKHIHNLLKKQYPQFKITIIMSETPTSTVVYSGED
ncbi:MAG: 6-carboxytetrahydropterin synthase [Candidatus Heimdallarchaeota archaeon]|nr:6-carboxytetrahydropterin synthase [Candidatus Heimdallarchaeota archaeon]MCK4768936.1 6-carboxytetrahydropterin synthase [Candidatus Heimdallarchaeota archaeon]